MKAFIGRLTRLSSFDLDAFTVGVPAEALDDEEEGPEETEPLGVGKR